MVKIQSILLFIVIISLSMCANLRGLLTKGKPRSAGILMHITSLPSNYGIGTLGAEAFKFVDFLVKAKQKNWQMLPVNPTGYGDSPYLTISSYAGNPYMIDLDVLISEKLLEESEVMSVFWGDNETQVDFGNMWDKRYVILEKAFKRFKPNENYDTFIDENKDWLDDYALFMALKEKFDNKEWTEWPEDIKLRGPNSIERYNKELADKINFHKFIQFKFYEQFHKLRDYCHKRGIKLIGDVPIYVPLDSCDVWANPEIFQLDSDMIPTAVAGVPPDVFSEDGQLWGNPLYDWDKMAKDDYKWFINRLRSMANLFDVIRIDHFRGLASYWSIPNNETTAKNGKWIKGPDMGLIKALHRELPDTEFIAEDLGYLTPEVIALREGSGFPGIKVLEFAFDAREKSDYLPFTYIANSVCYAATHDNEVLIQWQKVIPPEDRKKVERYFGLAKDTDLRMPILRAGMASVSYLFVAQLQDYLGLGAESRMNRPGTSDGKNWLWRATREQINDKLAKEIAHLTTIYSRS
jgi:4-alpha-glucanotransferase